MVSPPGHPARIITLMNQKGGVGKTTSTVSLGAAIARLGRSTLLIDLDPQAHLTLHLGLDPVALDHTVYDLLVGPDADRPHVDDVIQPVGKHLDVLPAHVNLAGVESELAPRMVTGTAQRVLMQALSQPGADGAAPVVERYEFILIDCPPSLGLLTVNALTLANEVLVPLQAHFLALQGLSQLLDTVTMIRQSFNPALRVSGVLLCMHENQTLLAQEVIADLGRFLDAARDQDVPWRHAKVLEPPIRRNIKLAECPSFGQTVFDYAPTCHGARDYRKAAEDLIAHGPAEVAGVASDATVTAEPASDDAAPVPTVEGAADPDRLQPVAQGAAPGHGGH